MAAQHRLIMLRVRVDQLDRGRAAVAGARGRRAVPDRGAYRGGPDGSDRVL